MPAVIAQRLAQHRVGGVDRLQRPVENTTPNPNVSSARLRSKTVTSADGSARRMSVAKNSPPGPPPATAIRMTTAFPLT